MKPLKKMFEKEKVRTRKSSPSPARGATRNDLSTICSGNTLGSGNLRMAVTLPQGEDLNEWIACNIADFYKQVDHHSRGRSLGPIYRLDNDVIRLRLTTLYIDDMPSNECHFEIHLQLAGKQRESNSTAGSRVR